MFKPLTSEQKKLIKEKKNADEQAMFAQQGVSSAVEDGEVVTIGNGDCDYCESDKVSGENLLAGNTSRLAVKGICKKCRESGDGEYCDKNIKQ